MRLRIGRDGNFEIADLAQARDERGRIGVTLFMRHEGRADAALRIAAQRHDVAHAGIPIGARDIVDLVACSRRRR